MKSLYIPRNLLFFVLLFIGVGSLLVSYKGLPALPKPQSPNPTTQYSNAPKRIVGFLPYWQMGNIETLRFDLLSEVAFFGLHIDETGALAKEDSNRLLSDSFARLKQKAEENNTQMSVVLILQDNEAIEIFLKNQFSWQTLSDNLKAIVDTYHLSGINVDFEYQGIPAKETINSFSSFVEKLNHTLKKENPNLALTVDITADAIKKSRLYDVEKLAQASDFIVLMGYDFYRPSSSVAGPVAPLLGKEIYEYDVTTAVYDFLATVPAEKLLLGVPYYGWDFPTIDDTRGSSVEKRPDESVALSTYKRNVRLLEEGNVTLRFDTDSQTSWLFYHDPDTDGIRQIWFEDKDSLSKKYDLVKDKRLAGVAIWALGYDGEHPELWDLLANKFR